MDAIKAIMTRRSIRKYTAEPVEAEQVETLLQAAMAAPSAGNQQVWHYVVIRDQAVRDGIPRFHPHAKMASEAPVVVVVCADTVIEKFEGYWVQDCSAAVENLLVAANAEKLGAVWLGIHPRPERVAAMKELLGLPESVMPLAAIAIGHPDEEKEPGDRFDPSRVHHDKW